ncbi:hypothetical protein GQ457_15G023450 [Hibiscus cannabinus]
MHAANSPVATILEKGSPVHMHVANSLVATVLQEGSQAQMSVANSHVVVVNPLIATVPVPEVVDNSGFPTYSLPEVVVPLEPVPTEDIAYDFFTPGSHRKSVIDGVSLPTREGESFARHVDNASPISATTSASRIVANVINTHPMVTRSKAGVYKPKVFVVECHDTPSTVKEALEHPLWAAAVQEEYDALMRNETWDLVQLPADRKAIGSKRLFNIKFNSDGSVSRYKARLVAKDYSQIPGYDFAETFSPVIRFFTVNILLSLEITFQLTYSSSGCE